MRLGFAQRRSRRRRPRLDGHSPNERTQASPGKAGRADRHFDRCTQTDQLGNPLPIRMIEVGDELASSDFAERLLNDGFYTPVTFFPTGARSRAGIRICADRDMCWATKIAAIDDLAAALETAFTVRRSPNCQLSSRVEITKNLGGAKCRSKSRARFVLWPKGFDRSPENAEHRSILQMVNVQ